MCSQCLMIVWIYLISMSMSFDNILLAIYLVYFCFWFQYCRIITQSHCSSFGSNSFLIFDQINNRNRSLFIKLCRMCILESTDMSRKCNNHNLHSKTDTKIWDSIPSSIISNIDHAFYSPATKSPRNENTMNMLFIKKLFEHRFPILVFKFLSIQSMNIHFCLIKCSCMLQCFHNTDIRIIQCSIFASNSNIHFIIRMKQ